MKSIYIIAFLSLSISICAQENKSSEIQDQAQVLLKAKENALAANSREIVQKKPGQGQLVSDLGLEIKKQTPKENQVQSSNNSNTGKLLPNTATLEEILATIPNRQARKVSNSMNTNNVQGLPNTATLEEIKKTIPKN